jgi:hypothetical protein
MSRSGSSKAAKCPTRHVGYAPQVPVGSLGEPAGITRNEYGGGGDTAMHRVDGNGRGSTPGSAWAAPANGPRPLQPQSQQATDVPYGCCCAQAVGTARHADRDRYRSTRGMGVSVVTKPIRESL